MKYQVTTQSDAILRILLLRMNHRQCTHSGLMASACNMGRQPISTKITNDYQAARVVARRLISTLSGPLTFKFRTNYHTLM